jgi:hypothetical protein
MTPNGYNDRPDVVGYLRSLGFDSDPFASTIAEQETRLPQVFLPRSYFFEVLGSAATPATVLLHGPTGFGKTTCRRMLLEYCDSVRFEKEVGGRALAVDYSDFTAIARLRPADMTVRVHVEEILRLGVDKLYRLLLQYPHLFSTLAERERSEIKAFIVRFSDHLSSGSINRELRKAGAPVSEVNAEFLRRAIRDGQTSVERVIGLCGSSARHVACLLLSLLGTPDAGDPSLLAKEAGPGLLQKFAEVVWVVGIDAVYVVVDRLEEQPQTVRNPGVAMTFLRPLLDIVDDSGLRSVAFKFFLSSGLADLASQDVRTQSQVWRGIEWSEEELLMLLQHRLRVYSAGRIGALAEVAETPARADVDRAIIAAAGGSPRRLLRLCTALFTEHCWRGTGSELVSESDVRQTIKKFIALNDEGENLVQPVRSTMA